MLRRFAGLFGPIFIKEIIEIARRRRYYFARAFYAIGLLLVLFIVEQEFRHYVWRLGNVNAMAFMAMQYFNAAASVQYAAVFFLVPMFLCGTIAGEREERTLDLLFATHLSNREIVLGKLGSRLTTMVGLIFCGLPVLSLVMLYGGVAPESLWRVLSATLAAMLFVGAHAIYFSATTASTLAALVRTYWWVGVWVGGVPLAVALGFEIYRPWRVYWQPVMVMQLFVNPVFSCAFALDGYAHANMVRYFGTPWYFPGTLVLPAAWSAFLLWRAVRRLRQTPVPVLQWVQRMPGLRAIWRWWQRPAAVTRRRRAAERTWLGAVQNPIWLRARLAPVYDRTGHLRLLQWVGWGVVVFLILLLAVSEPRAFDDEEASMAFLAPTWIAIAGLITLVAGTSLVGDRRRGFLELVLVTPLTGQEIASGTFLSIWEHLRPIAWLPVALTLVFSLTGASPLVGALASLVTAVLFCAILIWHGIACSLAARTVPAALSATFAFPIATLVGTGLLIGLFEEAHGPVLWVLCVVLLVGSSIWIYWRLNVASVATFLIAVHLAMCAATTFWTYDGRQDEYPVAAMHAAVTLIALLDDRPERWLRTGLWPVHLVCYWSALGINLVVIRYWVIRHFDRLAERNSGGNAVTDPP